LVLCFLAAQKEKNIFKLNWSICQILLFFLHFLSKLDGHLNFMRKILSIYFLAAWLLFPLSVLKVKAESIDQRLFNQIHDRWQRDWLDKPMELLTNAGEAEIGIALCAGVGLFGGEKARQSAKLALTADLASALLTYGLKNAVNRPRPEGPTERSNSSFPSGHSTGAFALATVFAHQYPGISIPCYTAATGIALSRVSLGRHYPSDVLAGAAIGFATARLVLHFRKGILDFEFDTWLQKKFQKDENPAPPDSTIPK
jgi:undecaprenyl-diphosphatase